MGTKSYDRFKDFIRSVSIQPQIEAGTDGKAAGSFDLESFITIFEKLGDESESSDAPLETSKFRFNEKELKLIRNLELKELVNYLEAGANLFQYFEVKENNNIPYPNTLMGESTPSVEKTNYSNYLHIPRKNRLFIRWTPNLRKVLIVEDGWPKIGNHQITKDEIESAVKTAIEYWNQHCHANLEFAEDKNQLEGGDYHVVNVAYLKDLEPIAYGSSPHLGSIEESQIYLGEKAFTLNQNFKLENLIIHEIGHVMGFDHGDIRVHECGVVPSDVYDGFMIANHRIENAFSPKASDAKALPNYYGNTQQPNNQCNTKIMKEHDLETLNCHPETGGFSVEKIAKCPIKTKTPLVYHKHIVVTINLPGISGQLYKVKSQSGSVSGKLHTERVVLQKATTGGSKDSLEVIVKNYQPATKDHEIEIDLYVVEANEDETACVQNHKEKTKVKGQYENGGGTFDKFKVV